MFFLQENDKYDQNGKIHSEDWFFDFHFLVPNILNEADIHFVFKVLAKLGDNKDNNKKLKIMEFSIQILPSSPFDGKKTFFYVFIVFIITKFSENFEEKMDIWFLKMFRTKKVKSKSPTDSRDFCPDPPSNEKLKSSLFWMN